jgi:hypothetical protein
VAGAVNVEVTVPLVDVLENGTLGVEAKNRALF